jgi:hypothetical protein
LSYSHLHTNPGFLKLPKHCRKTPHFTPKLSRTKPQHKRLHIATRHPPLATAVEENKPNQTKNKKEQKAKARKKKSA